MGGRGASIKGTGNKSFSNDEKDAIEYYVSGDGMYINQSLRRGESLDSGERAFIKDLDSATNRTLGETTLYRSVDASAVFGNMSQSDYQDLVDELVYKGFSSQKGAYSQNKAKQINNTINKTVGKEITDKGYMSTTKDYNVARDFGGFTGSDKPIVLKIKTNKSTKGADVSYTDKNATSKQKEVLLSRNQKMKVNKVSAKDGNIYVEVQLK